MANNKLLTATSGLQSHVYLLLKDYVDPYYNITGQNPSRSPQHVRHSVVASTACPPRIRSVFSTPAKLCNHDRCESSFPMARVSIMSRLSPAGIRRGSRSSWHSMLHVISGTRLFLLPEIYINLRYSAVRLSSLSRFSGWPLPRCNNVRRAYHPEPVSLLTGGRKTVKALVINTPAG